MNRLAPLLLLIAGCYPGHRDVPPEPEKPSVDCNESVWHALAERVDSGKVIDTDELILIVRDMKEAGDVTDTKPFEDALPTLGATNIILDTKEKRSQVSDALRKL